MDRADYLGDPDFTPIPTQQLLNPAYAEAWRNSIDPTKPTPSKDLHRPANFLPPPPTMPHSAPEPTQTTHFSIVDAEGNAVSNTYTLNGGFGSGVTVAPLGFLMNNEMDDFAAKQGVPNMYGLIQGPANAIGPGKRPLSAMTPTIVTTTATPGHPAELRFVLGTPGGSTIITTVANDFLSVVENGLNIQQTADAPRFHHQYLPDRIDLETRFSPSVADQLAQHGLHGQPHRRRRRAPPRHLGRLRTHRHRPKNPRPPRRTRQTPQLRQSRRLLTPSASAVHQLLLRRRTPI